MTAFLWNFCLLLNSYSFYSVMWSLGKQPTFLQCHQWFPRDMTSEKRAQKFLSELAPQTSCRGENSGCSAKCRPFSQAMWCKALGILNGMCDLLTRFTQKLTERLQVSFLRMQIPSLHELIWLAINQIRQSAMIYLWTEHGTTGCRCFYLRKDCVTSWKCDKNAFPQKV